MHYCQISKLDMMSPLHKTKLLYVELFFQLIACVERSKPYGEYYTYKDAIAGMSVAES